MDWRGVKRSGKEWEGKDLSSFCLETWNVFSKTSVSTERIYMYVCAGLWNKMFLTVGPGERSLKTTVAGQARDYNRSAGGNGIKEEREASGTTVLQINACERQGRLKEVKHNSSTAKSGHWGRIRHRDVHLQLLPAHLLRRASHTVLLPTFLPLRGKLSFRSREKQWRVVNAKTCFTLMRSQHLGLRLVEWVLSRELWMNTVESMWTLPRDPNAIVILRPFNRTMPCEIKFWE